MAFVGKVKAGDVTGRVGSSLYGVCASLANVAAKEVAIEGLDTLMQGLTIHVKFTNSNRASSPTLTIPSTGAGAIPIYRHGATAPGLTDRESWYAGSVLALTYDGSAWQINDWQSDTIYNNATQSVAGLMSPTDKANLDDATANRTTSLKFENVSTSTWAADNTYTNYGFKASIACTGVTANHFAEVCFAPDDVLNYVPAPVCVTAADTVYVWAMVNPGQALTGITVLAILPDRS